MNTKIYIDPNHRITYSSFYIKGIIDVFGERNIKFSSKYFSELKSNAESHTFDHYFAFVAVNGNQFSRIVIDFRDKRSIKHSAYEWCDIYAKINYCKDSTPVEYQSKIISIPPSFGIHLYGKLKSAFLSVANLLKSYSRLTTSVWLFLANYKGQYVRPKIEEYQIDSSIKKSNYCFFVSTLWDHKNCIEGTNKWRALYIQECKKQPELVFEGGLFTPPPTHTPHYISDNQQYTDISIDFKYSYAEYLEKTKKSLFVFNTPAVYECHGWKLGEYMAMGKAIISTPLSNCLPEPLKHGENIYFVNSEEEIKEAIQLLLKDEAYRNKLEKGIKKYYEKYASPSAVIKYIINAKNH